MTLDLDAIERVATTAKEQLDGGWGVWYDGNWSVESVDPDTILAMVARIRELEAPWTEEHADDCMAEIGKRAGYWNCDCKEQK